MREALEENKSPEIDTPKRTFDSFTDLRQYIENIGDEEIIENLDDLKSEYERMWRHANSDASNKMSFEREAQFSRARRKLREVDMSQKEIGTKQQKFWIPEGAADDPYFEAVEATEPNKLSEFILNKKLIPKKFEEPLIARVREMRDAHPDEMSLEGLEELVQRKVQNFEDDITDRALVQKERDISKREKVQKTAKEESVPSASTPNPDPVHAEMFTRPGFKGGGAQGKEPRSPAFTPGQRITEDAPKAPGQKEPPKKPWWKKLFE